MSQSALLHGVGHTQQEYAVVFRLLGDHNVDRLPLVQVLDKFGIEPAQVRLRHYAIALAAHIYQQFRGPNLDDHTFAQVTTTRHIEVDAFVQVLLEQLQVGCPLRIRATLCRFRHHPRRSNGLCGRCRACNCARYQVAWRNNFSW